MTREQSVIYILKSINMENFNMNTSMHKIDAIIFDMDGLLIDSENIAKIAWSRALLEFHFQMPDDFFLQLIGITMENEKELFYSKYGSDFPFEKALARRQHYYDEYIQEFGISLKPGVRELITFLNDNSIKISIATSSEKIFASKKLKIAGIFDLFNIIIFGDEVNYGKPSPDIFLEAARRLCTQPTSCVVLEDSEVGIRAAHAAKMIPIMVPDLQKPSLEITKIAHIVLPSLYDVQSYLLNFLF